MVDCARTGSWSGLFRAGIKTGMGLSFASLEADAVAFGVVRLNTDDVEEGRSGVCARIGESEGVSRASCGCPT